MASEVNPQKSEVWNPARFTFSHASTAYEVPFTVIILNQPIEDKSHLVDVCSRAAMIYCADGGANRLYDLGLEGEEEKLCRPAAICGDLDSVRPEVLSHYRQRGARVLKDTDQYSTDFQKCLRFVAEKVRSQATDDHRKFECHDVAIFGGLGGRADQAFSNLNLLYANRGERHPSPFPSLVIRDLYLITPESIIFCLCEGESKIMTPVAPGALGESVGIIPLGTPATITTKGLEWDVENWPTVFGGQVSTSNHIKSASVTVKSTARVLFTVEISKEPYTGNENNNTKGN